jgi:hypothetical protein
MTIQTLIPDHQSTATALTLSAIASSMTTVVQQSKSSPSSASRNESQALHGKTSLDDCYQTELQRLQLETEELFQQLQGLKQQRLALPQIASR